jgi:hypothetical protein
MRPAAVGGGSVPRSVGRGYAALVAGRKSASPFAERKTTLREVILSQLLGRHTSTACCGCWARAAGPSPTTAATLPRRGEPRLFVILLRNDTDRQCQFRILSDRSPVRTRERTRNGFPEKEPVAEKPGRERPSRGLQPSGGRRHTNPARKFWFALLGPGPCGGSPQSGDLRSGSGRGQETRAQHRQQIVHARRIRA